MAVRIFRCKKCGQMVFMLNKTGCDIYCCGDAMVELMAGEVDAAVEKHVPVYEVKDGIVNVTVGSVIHPMTEAHYIQYIVVETKNNIMVKELKYTDEPKASFRLLDSDEVVAVYEYCNLHGLWKK